MELPHKEVKIHSVLISQVKMFIAVLLEALCGQRDSSGFRLEVYLAEVKAMTRTARKWVGYTSICLRNGDRSAAFVAAVGIQQEICFFLLVAQNAACSKVFRTFNGCL